MTFAGDVHGVTGKPRFIGLQPIPLPPLLSTPAVHRIHGFLNGALFASIERFPEVLHLRVRLVGNFIRAQNKYQPSLCKSIKRERRLFLQRRYKLFDDEPGGTTSASDFMLFSFVVD